MFAASAFRRPLVRADRVGWIGVDVGGRTLKLAQAVRVGGGLKIVAARVTAFSKPLDFADPPAVRDALGAALDKSALRRAGFVGRAAACALSMSATPTRLLELPPASDADLRAMVAEELAAEDPTADDPTGGSQFDFWQARTASLEGGAADALAAVQVLSVPRPLARAVAEALRHAGLEVRTLDGLPLAVARAVRHGDGKPLKFPCAVLDLGHAAATFAVVVADGPAFLRALRGCGFGGWLAAVAEQLGLSQDEAAELLADGLADAPPDDREELLRLIGDATGEATGRLGAELERTLTHLRTRHPDLVPAELCLLGGGAAAPGLAERLADRLGLPVRRWSPVPGGPATAHAALLGPAAGLSALAWT